MGLKGFTLPVLAAVAAAGGVIFANQVASVAAATDNKLVDTIPMIDMSAYLDRENRPEEAAAEVAKVADSLHRFGALVIKDPRVEEQSNTVFIDMLEKYFYNSDGKRDARPEMHYQVGVTPENTERPRNHCHRSALLDEKERPYTGCPPDADPKWRFFWRIGSKPKTSKYPQLNADPVIPEEIPEWSDTMDMWGTKMLTALHTLAGMAAEGLDLPSNTFQDMMQDAPHLLAPTGSDFNKYGANGTVLAGYHYDLNFLTIHGKSRFPGLYVWLRDGRRMPVKVPPGHLIVQAGKQIEYLTGGYIMCGFHEVVVNEATMAVIDKKKAAAAAEGRDTSNLQELWRVSSTLFGHIASDQVLKPMGRFATPEALAEFPPVETGQQVQNELNAINLGADSEKNEL